jgi:hypothetical protein
VPRPSIESAANLIGHGLAFRHKPSPHSREMPASAGLSRLDYAIRRADWILRTAVLRSLAVSSGSCPRRGLLFPGCLQPHPLVVACLGRAVSRTAVMAQAASCGVASVAPTAWRDRMAMPDAEPLSGWGHFETQHTALRAVPRPPACSQNGEAVTLTPTFVGGRHFLRSIAFRTSGVAVAGTPIAWPNGPAVNLAELFLARAGTPSDRLLSCFHRP